MELKPILSRLLFSVMNSVVPPRMTERRTEALTLEALYGIMRREKDPVYAPEICTLLPYRNPAVKALIYEMKYRRNERAYSLAGQLLEEELLALSEDVIGTPLLIPVPMHADRRRERGFNQTEALCERVLNGNLELEYKPTALKRITGSVPQQKLARKARLENMKGSMRADPMVKDRVCIVLDDVSTTGATLMECKRALRAAGAKAVYLLALAG
jgi:ComF family protein